ncbi:FAD-binding domain-containing protein [Aspergillus carlsbadensis]|nr:FAD-binding domain-containing protein [Aspergillus carlsbadensis]
MHFRDTLVFAVAITPQDDCWPSPETWNSLNTTVHGNLIANHPIAQPCYEGAPDYDASRCEEITAKWTNSWFREDSPIGYSYLLIETCPPVNDSSLNPVCDLGPAPVYTIDATSDEDVVAGIVFAKDHNVRLVIKNTGHDIVGRSQGYGSLSIWIKHLREGIRFQEQYVPSTNCASNWTGSALTVAGGYVWDEVYAEAAKHGVIAVGGSDRSVGVIGGYLQGGGHGPVSHDFGLATDQVLEYRVVLASGEIVTANECEYPDLFMALRGGGGGTFGVVVSATIKVYPSRPALIHSLEIEPTGENLSDFRNAVADIISRFPSLSDGGFSGNALMTENAYTHNFSLLLSGNNSTRSEIASGKVTVQQEILDSLTPLNGTTLDVISSFTQFPTWHAYLEGSGAHLSKTGTSAILPSRFFDKNSLLSNQGNLSELLTTLFNRPSSGSTPTSETILELLLIGGGHVLRPAPYTSVNPAWRKTYLLMELVEIWSESAGLQGREAIFHDATNRKLRAMKDLTPGMGTYLNEADRNDPDYKQDWFGGLYDWLVSVKRVYDPEGVFWCYRCVGSEGWEERRGGTVYGPLCEVGE